MKVVLLDKSDANSKRNEIFQLFKKVPADIDSILNERSIVYFLKNVTVEDVSGNILNYDTSFLNIMIDYFYKNLWMIYIEVFREFDKNNVVSEYLSSIYNEYSVYMYGNKTTKDFEYLINDLKKYPYVVFVKPNEEQQSDVRDAVSSLIEIDSVMHQYNSDFKVLLDQFTPKNSSLTIHKIPNKDIPMFSFESKNQTNIAKMMMYQDLEFNKFWKTRIENFNHLSDDIQYLTDLKNNPKTRKKLEKLIKDYYN